MLIFKLSTEKNGLKKAGFFGVTNLPAWHPW